MVFPLIIGGIVLASKFLGKKAEKKVKSKTKKTIKSKFRRRK